jgi:hypothetical protein
MKMKQSGLPLLHYGFRAKWSGRNERPDPFAPRRDKHHKLHPSLRPEDYTQLPSKATQEAGIEIRPKACNFSTMP